MQNTDLLLSKYMSDLNESKNQFNLISERWNLLSLFDKMSDFHLDMSHTREEFQSLTNNLLIKLKEERLKKLLAEMTSKAQVAVDIVIRNLFERTADIGFLATDDDIRYFLTYLLHPSTPKNQKFKEQASLEKSLIKRFREYVAKYSVYDNIVLFDTNGEIKAQLDQTNKYTNSNAPFIREALTTSQDYVEYYGTCDISNNPNELVYAFKVTDNNSSSSKNIGVLVLFFKFEDEMNKIFNNLIEKNDWAELLLLDADAKVIASSDTNHIPLSISLEKTDDLDYKIVRYCGREYVAKTCSTKGYQGFYGLGWSGHVMIPLEHAFAASQDELLQIDPDLLEKILESANIFGKELSTIPIKAKEIQKELDLTIWNGNVDITKREASDNSFARSMLYETSKTGTRTNETFERSIQGLNNTIISSLLNDVSFLAKLSIDIMDRNLYERANDCRWWALTSHFKKSLNTDAPNQEEITAILEYINDLYTVYTNIFIYDKTGKVIAISNSSEQKIVGQTISYNWVQKTLSLRNTQDYTVSDFEKTPLYNNDATYIYGASITDLDKGQNILGGIGIVFDSKPELYEMLKDTLPKNTNGTIRENYIALYCDKNKKVISSTNSIFSIGSTLSLDNIFFNIKKGTSYSNIIDYDGKYYAVGSSLSQGYREYKVNDNYSNDVYAIVFVELGDSNIATESLSEPKPYSYIKAKKGDDTLDFSTFYVKDKVFALESKYILLSLNNKTLSGSKESDNSSVGFIKHMNKIIKVVDLLALMSNEKIDYKEESYNIIVLKLKKDDKDLYLGILVNGIYDSLEISKNDFQNLSKSDNSIDNVLIKGLINPSDKSKAMLLTLDIHALYEQVRLNN